MKIVEKKFCCLHCRIITTITTATANKTNETI